MSRKIVFEASAFNDFIEEGRLNVRIYTKGRLHAKAYILALLAVRL